MILYIVCEERLKLNLQPHFTLFDEDDSFINKRGLLAVTAQEKKTSI
jgi:hypothetical protein